ncbi:hypothetical protein [Mycolicibacterium sp. PDY-3]|uniref:hypothetical protein n=1 Tax=Mycolicibacterium sp. PDY-3 TaxID=3376069 RepID=UPI00379813AC
MTARVSVALNGMTFGDLYDFVDLARRADVARDAEVLQEMDENGYGPFTLEVILDNLESVQKLGLEGAEREHIAGVLDGVLSTDGDARGALDEIKLVRDLIR